MGKIPMQQWYPDAHIADTANLTLEEQGAYRLLMDHMWIKGGSLKNDDKEIARLLRISVKKWQKLKPKLEGYLLIYESILTHKRIQKDYKKACETSKINAENGRLGGLKTAEKWQSSQATALASSTSFAPSARRANGHAKPIGDVLNQLKLEP
jgi:hypothetical protein